MVEESNKIIKALEYILFTVGGVITGTLQIAGIVDLTIALCCLLFLGIVIFLKICYPQYRDLKDDDYRPLIVTAIITSFLVAFSFGCLYWYMSHQNNVRAKTEREKYAEQQKNQFEIIETLKEIISLNTLEKNSPNMDLKIRTLALSRQIMNFVEDDTKSSSNVNLYGNNNDINKIMINSLIKQSEFVKKFGGTYEIIISELKEKGIKLDNEESINMAKTNNFTRTKTATRLIKYANQLP